MTYSKLKPNNDQKKFISKQDTLMSRLYQAVPRARRETLAMHLGNKVRYGDLPDDYKEFLRTYKLEEAYQKCTGDLNKRSHSTNEMAAVEFLKICLIEKNVDVTWPLDKDADIYELEKLVRVSGHTELKHWLDQIEQWLAQEPLSNLTCVVRSYHRESRVFVEMPQYSQLQL